MNSCDTILAIIGWPLGIYGLVGVVVYGVIAFFISFIWFIRVLFTEYKWQWPKFYKLWTIELVLIVASIMGFLLAGVAGCPISA